MNIAYYVGKNRLCAVLSVPVPGKRAEYTFHDPAPRWVREIFANPGIDRVETDPDRNQIWITRISSDFEWKSLINDNGGLFGIDTIIGARFCPDEAVSRSFFKFENTIAIPK